MDRKRRNFAVLSLTATVIKLNTPDGYVAVWDLSDLVAEWILTIQGEPMSELADALDRIEGNGEAVRVDDADIVAAAVRSLQAELVKERADWAKIDLGAERIGVLEAVLAESRTHLADLASKYHALNNSTRIKISEAEATIKDRERSLADQRRDLNTMKKVYSSGKKIDGMVIQSLLARLGAKDHPTTMAYCEELKVRAEEAEAKLSDLRALVAARDTRIRELIEHWSDVEARSADAHAVYQKEAHKRGDVRHAEAYDDLSEPTKEWDRVLVRWVRDNIRAALFKAEPAQEE